MTSLGRRQSIIVFYSSLRTPAKLKRRERVRKNRGKVTQITTCSIDALRKGVWDSPVIQPTLIL